MKAILPALLLPLWWCLVGLTPITIMPEDRIKLTGFSEKILVVDVTKADFAPTEINHGLEIRKMEVEGRIVEQVRNRKGEPADEDGIFKYADEYCRVTDLAEFKKLHPNMGDLAISAIAAKQDQQSGIEACKVGGRYLIIHSPLGTYFVEVSKDNEDWRKAIQPYQDLCKASPDSVPAKNTQSRAIEAAARVRPALEADLKAKALKFGSPVFIRAFKEEMELELWVRNDATGKFALFRTYPIARSSGVLGPKLAEGDGQVPEGFYHVPPSAMNPKSTYHLSFNIGFPNAYDRAHGRTGSAIMIHGSSVSIGCLAMTDAKIEEIYTLCAAAHAGGQAHFRVHIFPFRMTDGRMAREKENRWEPFWRNLREGYDWFETHRTPPDATVSDKRYVFR